MTYKIFISLLVSFLLLGQSQGQCLLDSLLIEIGSCDENGMANVWLDFQYQEGVSDTFVVKGNGIDYGPFAYEDLPVNLGPLLIDPTLGYEFVVRDMVADSCQISIEYGKIVCESDKCLIKNLKASLLDSCAVNGFFHLSLDFESIAVTNVDILIDGDYRQSASTDALPLLLEIPDHHKDQAYIKVQANDQSECFGVIEVALPGCGADCGISDLKADVIECEDSSFFVKLDLNAEGPHSEHFFLSTNDRTSKLYQYDQLPLVVGPFINGLSDPLAFVVWDSLFSNCVWEAVIDGTPCNAPCSIGALETEIIQCDSGFFTVSIDFAFDGMLSDSFWLRGNGKSYGAYAYADLPVSLFGLAADGTTAYEFVVIDQTELCRNAVDIGTVDCYCLWSDFQLTTGDCTSDSTYVLSVNFEPGNVDSFSIYTGGNKLGDYTTLSLPLQVDAFPASGAVIDDLWICALKTNCCLRFEVESPVCARRACTISEVAVSPQSCDGGLYYVLLDFVYEGNSKDYFIVKKNGESLGQYKYDDLPVELGPFWSVDSSVQVLQLFDAENDDCRMEVEYMDPDCGSCSLEGLDVKVGECTSDSTYQVALDYNGTNPIDLYVNGQFFGSYDTVQLPVILDDFPASGLVFDHIKVCSLDSNYCCRDLELESPACVRNLCAFEDVRYELTDCDSNGNFHVVLSLDTIGRQEGTFVVKYGDARSEFSYESLPVKVGPYPAGETFYQFTVFDSEHPDCSALLNVGRVICPDRCDLAFGRIDIVECGDENLVILVDSLEGSFDAFDVYFADQYLGFHHAEELPLRLKAYHPTSPEATIRICVSDNTTCCFERVLSIDDCPGSTSCQIGALTFDTLECRNDSFYVNLNFSEQPLDSNSYELKVNGDLVRSFSASELPLHIGPFLSGADKRYSFVVKSGQAESCQSELVLEDVVCPASSIVEGTHMLILESGHFTNYLKVPEFVTQRSIFQLIDLSGRVLYEIDFSIETDRAVLPLPMDAAGMYLVRISSKEGQQLTTKIIIP